MCARGERIGRRAKYWNCATLDGLRAQAVSSSHVLSEEGILVCSSIPAFFGCLLAIITLFWIDEVGRRRTMKWAEGKEYDMMQAHPIKRQLSQASEGDD